MNVPSMRLVLAPLLIGALAGPASAESPRPPRAEPQMLERRRPGPGLDWTVIRERTRHFEALRRSAELQAPEPVLAPSLRSRISRLQALLGPAPSGLARLRFPAAPSSLEADRFEEAAQLLDAVRQELDQGVRAARESLALQEVRVREAGSLVVRIEGERRVLEDRSGEARGLVTAATDRLAQRRGGWSARVAYWVAQVRGAGAAAILSELATALHRWGGGREVLGAELTYVRGALTPPPLPTADIVPAHAEGDASLRLEDTTAGREIERAAEVSARAAELRTAAAAYEFVKNEFRLDWYYGSLKGSTQTFRDRRGNDVDLAAVLIALLRAQGVPARYVRGTIELSVARLAELMGLLTASELAAIEGGGSVPGVARQRALAALPAAGIPFEVVLAGGTVSAVRFVHTWVEAYIAYGDYRGAGQGKGAKAWVALDPALPGGSKYAALTPAVDALVASGLTSAALGDEYLAFTGSTSPLAFVRDRIGQALAGAGLAYGDVQRRVTSRPEVLGLVPGSLPYVVRRVHGEDAFVPDELKHRVRFVVSDAQGVIAERILPLHRVVGHRTIFAWEPATESDATVISTAGGIYEAPASAVQVLPVLRVDGAPEVQGTRAVGLGAQANWRLELLLPDGSIRMVANSVIAGNVVALGFGGPGNGYVEANDEAGYRDGPAARFLYARAAEYATRWTDAEEELARVLQIVPLRPTASLVLVENQLAVDEVVGVRRRVVWKGLQIDADHRTMVPLELVAGRDRDLLRLSGLHGSYLEAEVLRTATGVEAVSAVSVIQEAHRRGAEVLTIRAANAPAALAQLVTTPAVRREVEDQLARGREVTIPAADLTVQDWTGTGFIARDTATDEAGYFLSGVISGGQTITSPGRWSDQQLVAQLSRPAQNAVTDTRRIAKIVKIPTAVQEVMVGETAPDAIGVYVTTLEGVPVANAPVHFRTAAPSAPRLRRGRGELGTTGALTVYTDDYGLAKVWVEPDTNISAHAILRKVDGRANEELRGLNLIMAETQAPTGPTIAIAEPFWVLARNAAPDHMAMRCPASDPAVGDCGWSFVGGVQLGRSIYAQVLDRHGNWVPNQAVTWQSSQAGGRFVDPTSLASTGPRALDPLDAAQTEDRIATTGTDGIASTDYIPPLVDARADLWATAASARGRFSLGVWRPEASDTRTCVLKVRRDSSWFDGSYQTDFPSPVGAQVFLSTGDAARPWAVAERSSGLEVRVKMEISGATVTPGGAVLRTLYFSDEKAPWPEGVDVSPPLFDDRTAAFWPKFRVDGGEQRTRLTATVRAPGAAAVQCAEPYELASASARAVVDSERVLPGWHHVPADEYQTAYTDDLAVAFRVRNPANYPLYARFVEEPITAGQGIVQLPLSERHPAHPDLFRIAARPVGTDAMVTTFRLPLRGGAGGRVRLVLFAPKPSQDANAVEPIPYGVSTVRVVPPDTNILTATEALQAKVILPVRNFESAATPEEGAIAPPTATEPPIVQPAKLNFRVKGHGDLTVTAGGELLARATVDADVDGYVVEMTTTAGVPSPGVEANLSLSVPVAPGSLNVHDVTITFGGKTKVIPFATVIKDAGALPIGHTFVKDVSVVDGHLQKSFVDLSISGRNGGLSFTRSYTNRSLETTPMGAAWTHSLRSWITHDQSPGRNRYLLVGGEGTGQVFDCAPVTGCTPQRGYHGKLEVQSDRLVYTARNGTRFVYARKVADADGHERAWLTSIVDPRGNETAFLYYGAEYEGELFRVFEPGNRRVLELTYEWPGSSAHPLLATVSLRANPLGTLTSDSLPPIDDRGVCVRFTHDGHQNLLSALRYDGACRSAPEGAIRTESYEYATGTRSTSRDNLTAYVDPNGHRTEYSYHDPNTPVRGETAFSLMSDREERVRTVREPAPGGTTTFAFSLEDAGTGTFETTVTSTRVRGSSAPTIYRMNRYGASSHVVRGGSARTTVWDPKHIRPTMEIDPRGRTVMMSYDDRGNLVARRTTTTRLAAAGAVPETESLLDEDGNVVSATMERWAYDPDYGGETCRIDAEGRVTTTTYTLGLPLARREYSATVDPAAATSSCADLAGPSLAQSDVFDRVTQLRYCGVPAGSPCAENARQGDLVSTADGPRRGPTGSRQWRTTTVARYDALGYPERTVLSMDDGQDVVSTKLHDARGRVTSETDSPFGHTLLRGFDGLDRVRWAQRLNDASASPGEHRVFSYSPGGQLVGEVLGEPSANRDNPANVRWRKIVALDAINLPETVTETIATADGERTFVRTTLHDEAGNVWREVDRRGVERTTYFDDLDRPSSIHITAVNRDLLAANNGEVPDSFALPRQIASFTYDAAGNKLTETDLHGHTTRYVLDPLYRVVGVVSPQVPRGLVNSGSGTAQWLVQRRYDLVGNKVREVENTTLEGNPGGGSVTTWTYDFGNRVLETVDPVGRFQQRTYDGLGELVSVRSGYRSGSGNQSEHYRSETRGYDALGRSLGTSEPFVAGATITVPLLTRVAYDDAQHRVIETDRRGAITERRLDDLDRVYQETVDLPGRTSAIPGPALGLTTTFTYDCAGHRARMTDPLGRTSEDVYDGLGRLEQRRLPMGVTETTRYDGEGNVIGRTDRRNVTTSSFFDPLGREIRRTLEEPLSGGGALPIVRRHYSDDQEYGGERTGLTHTVEIDARGNSTLHYHDALHREVLTLQGGSITAAWYDGEYRRGVRDPKGYVTELDHDGAGRPTAQREKPSAGGATSLEQSWRYDDATRTEEWTDRSGLLTVTTRDGLGRTLRIARGVGPVQAIETTSYDEVGNVVEVDDPNGHATTFAYDGANRKVSETKGARSAVAATTTFTYDAAGNRITTKGPRGAWAFDVRQTYDDLNRSVQTEVPTGDPDHPYSVTSRAFDGVGNKLCERRPLGGNPLGAGPYDPRVAAGSSIEQLERRVCGGTGSVPVSQGTRFRYDELSKLVSVIDAAGGEHSFVYDEVRNLIAKQDANGNLTIYAYDALNRRTDEWQHLDAHARLRTRGEVATVTDNGFGNAAVGTGAFGWHVDYDANGNPAARRDPRGVTVTSTFGLLNRLEAVSYPDDPGLRPAYPYPISTAYAYDGNGNVELVTEVKRFDPASVLTMVTDPDYDPTLGRLASERRYDGKVVAYQYDAKGNRKKVTDPDGVETSYDYDARDRLITVTTPAGEARYRYAPDGLLTGASLPSGLEEARCYDAAGRVTAIVTARGAIPSDCPNASGMVSRFEYVYDANGNRTRQVERRTDPGSSSIGAAEETRYGYDDLDRLVGVGYPDRAVLYQLDGVGNRVGERVAPASGTLALTAASYGGATTGLTSDLTATFNRVDWLVSQTDAVDGSRSATYGYDNAGNLTEKVRNGTVRQLRWSYRGTLTAVLQGPDALHVAEVGRYDYDADLQRLSRTTAAEQVEYVLDDRHVLQEASGAPGHPSYRRYHYGTGPLLVEDGGTRRFISTDALGSTTDLTTTGGTVASMRKYDAWGQYRNDTAPGANEPKLGFTGHQYDPETGLVYARARYYDPDLGRFISRDTFEGSLENAPSLHRYAYAWGNPARYWDRTGYEGEEAQAPAPPSEDERAAAEMKAACNGGNGGMCALETGAGLIKAGANVVAGSVKGAVAFAKWFWKMQMALDPAKVVVEDTKKVGTTLVRDVRDRARLTYRGLATEEGRKDLQDAINKMGVRDATATIAEPAEALLVPGATAKLGGALKAVRAAGAVEGVEAVLSAPEAVAAGDDLLFRGTTAGYPGSPGLQRIKVTPTSTDPVVSTAFATEAANFGEGVVLVARRAGLPTAEGNVLASLEAEVAVELAPAEFAKRAQAFSAGQAREVLKEMGINLPARIADKAALDAVLRSTPRLTAEQAKQFAERLAAKAQPAAAAR